MTTTGAARLEPIVDDIAFGESPRWHRGRVWYCDWLDGVVVSVTPNGDDRTVHARLAGFPICIDWDRDDRLVIVDGAQRRVMREQPDGLEVLADLSPISDTPWNEIVAHPSGRIYVNGIGVRHGSGCSAQHRPDRGHRNRR